MSSLGAPSRYKEHHGASFGDDVGRTCTRPCRGTTTFPQSVYARRAVVQHDGVAVHGQRPETDLRQLGEGLPLGLAAGQDDREASTCRQPPGATEPSIHPSRGTPQRRLVARLPDTDRVALPPVEGDLDAVDSRRDGHRALPVLTVHLQGDRLGGRRDGQRGEEQRDNSKAREELVHDASDALTTSSVRLSRRRPSRPPRPAAALVRRPVRCRGPVPRRPRRRPGRPCR